LKLKSNLESEILICKQVKHENSELRQRLAEESEKFLKQSLDLENQGAVKQNEINRLVQYVEKQKMSFNQTQTTLSTVQADNFKLKRDIKLFQVKELKAAELHADLQSKIAGLQVIRLNHLACIRVEHFI
jgi:hypothetical protein